MKSNEKKTGIGDILMKLGPLLVLALLFIIFTITLPGRFLQVPNLMNILKQTSVNCLIASGMQIGRAHV